MRTDEGREDFRRYYESAIDVPGPDLDKLCKIAKSNKVNLVGGVIERDGGTLHCSAVMIGRDGTFLGKHRKLVPTALERVVWGQGDGSTMPVVDMDVGKAGAVICWENRMPLLRTHMYAKGVELYCAPTVDDRDTWLPSMRHIAFEGRCFVLSCAQFTTRADFPDDYDCVQGNDPSTVLINGGSCIISPMGEVLAEPVFGKEAIVIADLDMNDIVRGKYDLDVTGHYARPDVFRLTVNEKPQPATEWE